MRKLAYDANFPLILCGIVYVIILSNFSSLNHILINDFSRIVTFFSYACIALYVNAKNVSSSLLGILEVLYCVLIESPEVLNIIQENHIKSIISLLDKHGRNHKVCLPPHCREQGGNVTSTDSN